MRSLIILRGAPGSGKSTFIKEHGLDVYTLCPDSFRVLLNAPEMTLDGTFEISQRNNKCVFKLMFDLLEKRMKQGEFTIIDAMHTKRHQMTQYKKLAEKYRYHIFIVDFTDVPEHVCLERNEKRGIKKVPVEVIKRFYEEISKNNSVPSGMRVIKPEEFEEKVFLHKINLSSYKKIHHLGDIHGCFTALQDYITSNGGIKDDEFYIFTGDYIDRGKENVEVVKFLMELSKRKNVLLLEGNHERWLNRWAHEETAYSETFEKYTRKELEAAGISKKEIRVFYRALGQCAFYQFNEKVVFVSHAGISFLPKNLTFVSTETFIHGVGGYMETQTCDDMFELNTDENTYQIHGHRNTSYGDIKVNSSCFNLEGQVEEGGYLRAVQLSDKGFETIEIKNDVFKKTSQMKISNNMPMSEIIDILEKNPNIIKKKFDNIVSYNFSKTIFKSQKWTDQRVKARGLYMDVKAEKLLARGYEKFFNIEEMEETKLSTLEKNLKFPVMAYKKENGFLGLVSFNHSTDRLFFTSKSNPTGMHSEIVKKIFKKTFSNHTKNAVREYLKAHPVTFVFEVIDIENDPHIIEYDKNQMILLDIIDNMIDFKKMPYEKLQILAKKLDLPVKEKEAVLRNWKEFDRWFDVVSNDNFRLNGEAIEGFVLEAADGFMVKYKTSYYRFWKMMRTILDSVKKNGTYRFFSKIPSEEGQFFYAWLLDSYQKGELPKDMNIIQARNKFYN